MVPKDFGTAAGGVPSSVLRNAIIEYEESTLGGVPAIRCALVCTISWGDEGPRRKRYVPHKGINEIVVYGKSCEHGRGGLQVVFWNTSSVRGEISYAVKLKVTVMGFFERVRHELQ